MKILSSVPKSKRVLRLFTVFTGSVACLSFSGGFLKPSSHLRTAVYSSSYRPYCQDSSLFPNLWDSAEDCLQGGNSWREKYPY